MRQSETLTRFVCDGCGAEAPEERAGEWRHLKVSSEPVVVKRDEGQSRSLDLCAKCVKMIVIPGLAA
jgi:hypothetical protein